MATTTAKPDPKPTPAKRRSTKGKQLNQTPENIAAVAEATEVGHGMAADLFRSGQSISQIALTIEKSHAKVRELLTEAGVDFSADKNAVDLKDRVRQASAATLARRAANEADKAKVSEQKAADRAKRDAAKSELVNSVIAKYTDTNSVKATAEAIVNEATGKPFSQTRIRRILIDAGVLESTTRGDTSARDAEIVARLAGGESVSFVAAHFTLSDARVRAIGKKGGVAVEGSTRGSKLPTIGTPEWSEFANDVSALCEKWGSALGTMAHAMRRAGSAAGS